MGYRTVRRRSVVAGIIVAGLCALTPSAAAAQQASSAGAAISAAAPAATAAASSVQIAWTRWPIANGATEFHSAFCPEGWTAIAGGVAVSNPRMMHIVDSRKAGDPRQWFASVRSLGPDGTHQTFDTYATCARDMNLEIRQQTYDNYSAPNSWSLRGVVVECSSRNYRVVGGGQSLNPYPNDPKQAYLKSYPYADYGVGDYWSTAGRNYGTTDGNATIYIVCTDTPLPGYQHVQTPLQSGGSGPAIGTAQCPPSTRVLTGGATSRGAASLANSYPTNNGTAWTATTYDPFTHEPASVQVTAVCAAI